MVLSSNTDDEVVTEIDVCISKALAERLFLFQYPVRPASLTYNHAAHLSARIKPIQRKVELGIAMDTSSSTYCYSRGEHIAMSVDIGASLETERMFNGQVMDRSLLLSVHATDDSLKYAAGIYSDGVLHITPIKEVMQLRPTFGYFDKADENQKKAASALIRQDENHSLSEDEVDEAKPVQLRFAKASAQTKVKQKHPSFGQLQAKDSEEAWINAAFFQPADNQSICQRNLLFCHQDDFESPEICGTSRDYLKLLQPVISASQSQIAALPAGVLSLLNLKKMELRDQIKALILNAKVIQLAQVSALLGGAVDEKIIISGLMQYAMLVQGCWVVKSDVLYPKHSKLEISGLEAEKIWPSRDYIMFCFNKKRILSRKEIVAATKLPTEELREVLEQMARQRPAQGWEFMLPTDVDFISRHQDAVHEEMLAWKERYKQLIVELRLSDDIVKEAAELIGHSTAFSKLRANRMLAPSHADVDVSSDQARLPKGRRNRDKSQSSVSNEYDYGACVKQESTVSTSLIQNGLEVPDCSPLVSVSMDSEIEHVIVPKKGRSPIHPISCIPKRKSNETLDVSCKTDVVIPDSVSLVSGHRIDDWKCSNESESYMQYGIEPSVMSKDRIKSEPDDIFLTDQVMPGQEVEVVEDHSELNVDVEEGIFVPPIFSSREVPSLEKPHSDIFIRELKKFCRDTLRSGCLSLAEFKDVLQMRQQEPGNILCTGVPDVLLEQCIKDTGAVEIPLKWPSSDKIPVASRRVFIYRTMGESNDKFRKVVIDLFHKAFSLRRKEIVEACKTELGEQPTYHVYSKMIMEFCENHGGQWYLSGTFKTCQIFGIYP